VTGSCCVVLCVLSDAVPERYLLLSLKHSIRRLSLDTADHGDVLVMNLKDLDLDSVIALDVDVARRQLYFIDVHRDVIRSRDLSAWLVVFVMRSCE